MMADVSQRLVPFGRGPVQATAGPALCGLPGNEVTAMSQPVQHGIQRSRADAITVAMQLGEHFQAVKFILRRVVQDM